MRFGLPAPRTLRARVTIATALVLAVVLGLVGWFVDRAVDRSATRALDEALQLEAEALCAMIRIEGDRVELDTDSPLRLATFDPPRCGAYYQVTVQGRKPLRSPSLDGAVLPPPPDDQLGPATGTVVPALHRTTVRGPYEPALRLFTTRIAVGVSPEGQDDPPPGAPQELAVVQLGRNANSLQHARTAAHRALALALPLGLILGSLGAFLLARRATAPIARLSEEAHAIGVATPDARLDTSRVEGELRELAETLNQAFGRLESMALRERRFAADASHELRTPLAVLRSRLELMLSRERSPEEYRAALRTSLDAGMRLEQVVRALLTLARSDAGELRRERADLRRAVERGVETACAAAGAEASSVVLRLGDAEVPVEGESGLLERLVANLVENALTHGGGGGPVEVSLVGDATRVRLLVEDRGPGFAPDLEPRLFERFARADASRTRATGGAGLGLSIARSIARLHGGEAVAGPREGGGARVEVTLPRAA